MFGLQQFCQNPLPLTLVCEWKCLFLSLCVCGMPVVFCLSICVVWLSLSLWLLLCLLLLAPGSRTGRSPGYRARRSDTAEVHVITQLNNWTSFRETKRTLRLLSLLIYLPVCCPAHMLCYLPQESHKPLTCYAACPQPCGPREAHWNISLWIPPASSAPNLVPSPNYIPHPCTFWLIVK